MQAVMLNDDERVHDGGHESVPDGGHDMVVMIVVMMEGVDANVMVMMELELECL